MDALGGRPRAESIKTVAELRSWTLDARRTLVEGHGDGSSRENLAAMNWLGNQGNRVPFLLGATDFEPFMPANPYYPTEQEYIGLATRILAWCDLAVARAESYESRGQEGGEGGNGQEETHSPPLFKDDVKVLFAMHNSIADVLIQSEIAIEADMTEKTVRTSLSRLMNRNYVKRPDGKKRGYQLTNAGKEKIDSMRQHSPKGQ